MIRRCQLRCCAKVTLSGVVKEKRYSSAFLRSLPPEVYVSYIPQTRTHHVTSVVDVGAVPLSKAAFFLRSCSDGGDDVGTLIGLGDARTPTEAEAFVSKVLVRAKEDAPPPLQQSPTVPLQFIVLPALDPFAGNVLPSLLRRYPGARVVCSSFVAAFLTDQTFFSGASRALSSSQPGMSAASMPFPAVDPSCIVDATDGSTISLHGTDTSRPQPERKLSFVVGDLAARSKRRPPTTLPFMCHDSLLVYDSGSKSIFAGDVCGVRFPWLRFAHDSANPAVVLPVPPPLSATASSERASPLLLPWDIEESVALAISGLRRLPLAQRVISSSYGELAVDREGLVEQLDVSKKTLLDISSRADRFLERHGGADRDGLVNIVMEKIQSSLIFTQTSSVTTAKENRDAAVSFLRESALNNMAQCIVHAAMCRRKTSTLQSNQNSQRGRESEQRAAKSSTSAPAAPAAADQLKANVVKLQEAFRISGLPSAFIEIAGREHIDLDVFCAMTREELSSVFSPVFGDMKKLQGLQEFISVRRQAQRQSSPPSS